MTKRLDRMNPRDALYETARLYPGGIEALAGRLGVSESSLYKKLEGAAGHALRNDDFDSILALCAAAGVEDPYQALRARCWRHGHVAVQLPDIENAVGAELAAQLIRVFREGGDVARVIEGAVVDGRVSERELAAIESEIGEAVQALCALRELARTKVTPPRGLSVAK